MQRRTALKLPLLVAAGMALADVPRAAGATQRWTVERANAWYQGQGWLVGTNFVTSTAVNQIEMFAPGTYDPQRIANELQACRLIGFNTVRVFLHDLLWVGDRAGFQRRLSQFVGLAARNGIKPLFVLFDSCWNPTPKPGPQPAAVRGVHNSGWVQGPGAERLGDPRYGSVMQNYVTGVLSQFRNDPRVLGWDLWNEPDNPAKQYRSTERSDKLELVSEWLPKVFGWARAVDPIQPLTSGVWQGGWGKGARSAIAGIQLDNSDVISFHSYGNPDQFEARIDELAPYRRPMLCTEYLARTEGSTVGGILPIARRRNVAAYSWGLVAGKTQTFLPWDSWDKPYPETPKVWFHDLLQPDGRPYRDAEIRTIRQLTGAGGAR